MTGCATSPTGRNAVCFKNRLLCWDAQWNHDCHPSRTASTLPLCWCSKAMALSTATKQWYRKEETIEELDTHITTNLSPKFWWERRSFIMEGLKRSFQGCALSCCKEAVNLSVCSQRIRGVGWSYWKMCSTFHSLCRCKSVYFKNAWPGTSSAIFQ